MNRFLNFLRAVRARWAGRQSRGFAALPLGLNVVIFAAFSAWVTWLGEPTLKAWREADRILATHAIDPTGVAVLAFLALLSGSLLGSLIIAGAAYKAVVDRLQ